MPFLRLADTPCQWACGFGQLPSKCTCPSADEKSAEAAWGADARRFWADKDGLCRFFVAVDHRVEDVVGWHAAEVGDRFAAPEPVRQSVSGRLGPIRKDVAWSLALRADHGPQYTSRGTSRARWPTWA